MGKLQIGCQTYTWQMSGKKYLDKLPHIIKVASQAGFAGLEPETQFLGKLSDPQKMATVLKENGIKLAALCLVEDWVHSKETEQEKSRADKTIDFLKYFPGTVLCTCQMPTVRENLAERQVNLLRCVNELSRRASGQGILCAYHPNSPQSSIYRTREDYEVLLNGLDERVTGWAPDVGHIAKGGMDPLEEMKEYVSLIKHVHYKDMYKNGTWAQMGAGDIDFESITGFLSDSEFDGWIIVEDECKKAEGNPDTVTLEDGVYIKKNLMPLL